MTFPERKLVVLASWVAIVTITGLIFTIDRPDAWMWVATLALAPAAVANWLWNAPEATLAQLIARARTRS